MVAHFEIIQRFVFLIFLATCEQTINNINHPLITTDFKFLKKIYLSPGGKNPQYVGGRIFEQLYFWN